MSIHLTAPSSAAKLCLAACLILLLPRFLTALPVGIPETAVAVTPPGRLNEAREPQAAVTENGGIFVAFGAGDTVYCSASRDGGRSYSAPVKVAREGSLSLGMRRGPRIAVAGKTVVISAVYGRQGSGRGGELLAWRSEDNGKTWADPVRVSDVPGAAREGLHAMAASQDGRILACAWLDLRAVGTQIYASLSRDGGRTWGKNTCVYRSPSGTVCECCHPSLAFDEKGALVVLWRNALGGARDMYLTRSVDGGVSFSAPQKLGQGTWMLDACPMDGGAVTIGGKGDITTFWRRDQQLFTCAPGKPEQLVGRGQQGWAAAGRDGTYLVWLEGRPGRLKTMGPGAGVSRELAVSADDPVVAVSPSGSGPVIAVWTARQPGVQGIYSLILDSGR